MTDLAKPRSLSKVTENVGFSMADVALVSGLDESTVCRLWDAPDWLDRISGKSLQCLVASVPGVAEYFASYSVLARGEKLAAALLAEGLVVNPVLRLSATTGIPRQYLVNALDAALRIVRGDSRQASSYLARFWGLHQDRALEALYSTDPNTALLANPSQLFAASVAMLPLLARKSYSYHSILAQATFAHHLGIATGELSDDFTPRIKDRQTAFMVRSGIMGLLINSSNTELAQRYERMVKETPVLTVVEEWSFPTYTRDSKPSSDFSLPGSLLLRNTANEVLREIADYTDAYLYYLATTYLPLALERDPTFGLLRAELRTALLTRIHTCQDANVRAACASLAGQL